MVVRFSPGRYVISRCAKDDGAGKRISPHEGLGHIGTDIKDCTSSEKQLGDDGMLLAGLPYACNIAHDSVKTLNVKLIFE